MNNCYTLKAIGRIVLFHLFPISSSLVSMIIVVSMKVINSWLIPATKSHFPFISWCFFKVFFFPSLCFIMFYRWRADRKCLFLDSVLVASNCHSRINTWWSLFQVETVGVDGRCCQVSFFRFDAGPLEKKKKNYAADWRSWTHIWGCLARSRPDGRDRVVKNASVALSSSV